MTLYDQLGGDSVISVVVADFYDRVVADDRLASWFARTDGNRLQQHLRAYFAVALGGPENYSGKSMRRAHGGLHISGEAFDTMLVRLSEALVAAGVESDVVRRVHFRLESLRAVIVAPRAM